VRDEGLDRFEEDEEVFLCGRRRLEDWMAGGGKVVWDDDWDDDGAVFVRGDWLFARLLGLLRLIFLDF
jgi:hypothetical protein